MTTLVLTRFAPHRRTSGAELRNSQNIRALSFLGAVDVAVIADPRDDRGGSRGAIEPADQLGIRQVVRLAAPALDTAWQRLATRAWPVRPSAFPGIDSLHRAEIRQPIADLIARHRYDLVVVEGITLAPYVRDLKGLGCRVVFDAHNVESVLCGETLAVASGDRPSPWRLAKNAMVRRRLAGIERGALVGADLVWVCSDHDAQQVVGRWPDAATVAVVPNGIDVDSYADPERVSTTTDWSTSDVMLLYAGLFSYTPNASAAMRLIDDVLPGLRARGVRARAVLVGRDPTPAMVDAARRDSGVDVTGAVERVVPYLRRPCIVTLPIDSGSGTRLKIVEAFAAERPVVTTTKGAEGLAVCNGQELLVRDDVGSMIDAVIDVWRDGELRGRLCRTALATCRRSYSWQAAAAAIGESLGRMGAAR